ncbi:MAG: hypothetical protein GXP35_03585 [Actinobacteria bacterium]|nr:hypothetical protein [Actinomycetota bacterium]
MELDSLEVEVGLPFGIGRISGTWTPDTAERNAAWEMYVELLTRVSVADLAPEEGLLREALTSLHSLFDSTRAILRTYGPSVATANEGGVVTFGYLAVAILNGGLRPLLSKWHPLLVDHEERRPADMSSVDWERGWEKADELRAELDEVRKLLTTYAGILGEVCGAKQLLSAVEFRPSTLSAD